MYIRYSVPVCHRGSQAEGHARVVGGAVYHELLNPVSVPAVGLLINSSGELCVKGYKIDRKSPGMAFVTQWAMLQCSHRGSL